jgi:mannose-6-phosphate isomerase-like protein (cupin superfamily)
MSTSSIPKLLSSIALGIAGFALACLLLPRSTGAADQKQPVLPSAVVSWDNASSNKADWGEMRTYFRGRTLGTDNVLTAVAVVQPGKAVHRAHRHVEEEYLILNEGSGVWSLDGKEFPAKTGDILYVRPWAYHGLTNTGDKPLTFTVVRFIAQGVEYPPRPDSRNDEL